MKLLKYLFNWKYRYFVQKLRGVEKMIMDYEFKRYKTAELREEIRQEYDNLKSRLNIFESTPKDKLSKEEMTKIESEKEAVEKKIKEREEEMARLDLEVTGTKPNKDYPDGIQGINQYLESLRELLAMIKDYNKSL